MASLRILALTTVVSTVAHAQLPYQRCRLAATTTVTVSVPVPANAGGQYLFRKGSGEWLPIPSAKVEQGCLTFTLSPEQIGAGDMLLLLGRPDWLDLSDTTPPEVVSVAVDGKQLSPAATLDLGWIDTMPSVLVMEVRDERNPLDPASVVIDVAGTRIAADGKAVVFVQDAADRKRGRITCHLKQLLQGQGDGQARLRVECDDYAADEQRCSVDVTFTVTQPPTIELREPAATTDEGVKVFVDSIHSGYENVECLLDGQLQEPGVSTYGKTWASAETDRHHWVCFVFPESRQVSGLEISWANYRDTFWASNRYDIMAWDGQTWQRLLRVAANQPQRTTRHDLKACTTDRLLIWIPSGGGHPGRPDIAWMTEVAVLP